jgi:hypothetical protein
MMKPTATPKQQIAIWRATANDAQALHDIVPTDCCDYREHAIGREASRRAQPGQDFPFVSLRSTAIRVNGGPHH